MGLKKKMKKGMSGVQPKWRSWMTVASVFGGVTLVSGATVLGLFLTGRFDEKHITPEDIAFYYEENYNDAYSQLEVCEDFYLTINTVTEEVTETTVELSFADESNDVTTVDDYISNTIIRMPRFVEIGQPFKITLMEEEISFGAETIDWIKGGVSIIKAKSEYNMLSPISLQVAVDVPVWKIETEIVDENGDPLGNNVIRGEDFKMKTTFYPAKSRYMYSDDSAINNIAEENKRTKNVFYMATGANGNKVSPHYDDKYTMHYTASDNNVDGDLTIKSYVFANAIDQINYEESISQIADPSEYYSSMVSYIASGTKAFEDAANDIKISTASIDSFRIITNNIDPLYTGRMLTLYAGAGDGKSNTKGLGSIITAKNGSYIYNNFKYIAVRFTTGSGITISAATEIEVDGEVYYLPNTEVDDINLAYWEIYSEVVQSAKMEVVLIDQNEDGEYIIWNDIRHTVDFSISEKQEVAPAWNSTEAVNITLSVLPSGGYGNHNIDLSARRVVDRENTYTDTIYFVEYDEETNEKLLSEVIENEYLPAVEYSFSGSTTKKLFALTGENLTVKDNASLKVYIATVKSKVATAGVYDISLWCDSPLTVKCVKALSEASVENYSIVKISNAIENKTETMIYRSEENAQFLITFKVRDDAFEVFQTEFYKKKDSMVLSIFNKNGTNITGYFTIDGEAQIDLTNNTISFVITLNNTAEIETDDGEKESTSVIDQCILTFNQEGKEPIVWEKHRVVKDTDYSTEEYKVYKPVASLITFKEGEAISSEESQIKQELDESGESKITINGEDANYTQFIETLLGTNGSKLVITDQHNDINSLLGKWKLAIEEGSTKAISLTSTRKSFTLGTTEKTDVTETAVLTVWSDDDRASIAGFTITLNITSTGIVKAEGYTDILEEDSGVNKIQPAQKKAEDSTTEISVEVYGIEAREVALSDLFKLYVAYTDETTNTALSSGYTIKIDSSYWGALTSDVVNALKGMISFIDEEGNPIASIENVDIHKIKFNKPFGAERTLKFVISNANGAVNTTLNVKILPAITYAGQTAVAGVANTGIPLDNVVYYKEYKTLSSAPEIERVPIDKIYYVNQQTNNVCIIEETLSASTIASIRDGKIYFNDFYIDYSKEYKIQFSPDGNNSYALNQIVSFEITRNLNLPSEANIYYLYNSADGSAITGKRINDILGDGVGSVDGLTYYFDKYLEVDANNSNLLSLNPADKLIFAYNQKYIETTLKIQHNGNYIKDENGDDLVYTIKLALPEQSYKFMQNYFATGAKPISQVVNGVEYLVFDNESVGMSTETFPLQLTQKDENANSMGNEYIVIVEDTGTVTTTTLAFRNTNNNIAYEGVGEETSKIVLYSQEHLNVYVHVPVIIAHQGFETIVYEGMDENYYYTRQGEKYSMIEVALANETFLREKEFFKEIVGGSEGEILNATSGAGLYGVGKITSAGDAVVKEIKNLEGEDRENQISLNNLAIPEQYIILNYQLGGTILKYNIKVTQNVQGQIVYPYETSPEYITMPTFTEVTFDINEAFNNDTLNPNEFRLNVTDMMGNPFVGLTANTEIQLVKVEGISAEGFTSPAAWENYIIIEEANATDGLYTFTVKGNKDTGVNHIIEVKFKRTYNEIVGLEQIYTLRINDIKNYSIQMSENSAQGGEFTLTGEADCEYTVQHTAGKELNFKVLLIENADAGQGIAGTEVYNKLNIKCPEQPDIVTSVYYDNSNGTFKVTLGDYLATKGSVRFVAYTEYGVAGTIDIVLNPTYMVEKAESYKTQLIAGDLIALSDMFNVNGIALSQTCTSVEGSPLVKLNGQNLDIFDLYQDEDITLTFTFNDGSNDFVFTTSYTLKANLTISSATGVAVSGDEVYTDDSDFIKMFVKENGTGFSDNISIKSISSVSTDKKFYDVGAESTPNIVVTLEYKDGETTLWTIDVNYVVTVYPAVTMTPSYPKDIEGGKLSVEYVESGAAINFSENHLLAADPRAYIRMNSISGSSLNIDGVITDSTDIKYSDVTIKINSIQNAIVEVDGNRYTRTGYTSEGVAVNLYTNLIIDSLNEGITLTIDGSSVGNGKALVSFQIECRGVTLTYDVEIQKNVYTIGTHTVELNMADGVETIYIDQVDKEDLFVQNRMLEAKLKDSIPASQELIMIFNKGTEGAPEYYASASLYINKDHAGQTLTYDLGYNFELTNEDQIVALIPASVIVQKDSGLSIDTDRESSTFRQFTGDNLTQALLNSYPVGNYIESFKLTHRVEVLYSGISVNYDKFKEVISSTTLPSATVGGESADVTFIFDEFKIMNAGGEFESLSTTYKFKYAIDIAMDTSDLMVTVEVGQEDIAGVGMNAINLLGIKHPSTGALLSAVDFQTKSPILKFEIVDPASGDSKLNELRGKFLNGESFVNYTSDASKQPYLAYISVEDTESGKIVNHALSAMGAKNTGNYVLIKFTYKIGSEEQSFYTVVKVVPDYTIKFGGAVVNLGNENNEQVLTSDSISNSTIITFQDLVGVSGTNYYTGVTNNGSYLTSTADTNGYLSIVHSNSSNKPEISTTNFTITLPVGGTNDSGYEGFNNSDNINNKFDTDKIGENNWTALPESGEITSISATNKSKPVGVQKLFKQAVFANQDFYIEGKDIYGFTYRVRFRLVADSTPYVAEDAVVELTEGKTLDFAAEYSLIDVYNTETEKESKKILGYSTSQKAPTEGADSIVEFKGIAVNMFKIDDGETFLQEDLILNTGSDYLDEGDAIKNMIEAKVDATKIRHITVTGVELKDVGGQTITTITKPDTDQTLATSEVYYYASETAGRKAAGMYQVNWTPYKHLFGTGTTISDLKLVVTLKYDDGANVENAVVTVNNVKLNRGINTTQVLTPVENRTVYDGVSFSVNDHFENEASDSKFYQDTLEVVVPAGESTTFIVLNCDDGVQKEKIISNIGNQKGKTFRYSISEMFNTNDIVGKDFTVAADNENAKFYYNNQNILNEGTFTVSEIEDGTLPSGEGKDRIYLDDSTKGTARTEITKYYLYKKDGSATKYYRLERTYHVYPEFTGVKMEDEYSTEGMIIRALNAGDSTNLDLNVEEVSFVDTLKIGGITVLTFENAHDSEYDWLKYRVYFEIKKDETSAYGKAKLTSETFANDNRSESTIEIDDDFGDNEFILVNVYVVVSGSDRDHEASTGQYEKVLLTTLKLGKIL